MCSLARSLARSRCFELELPVALDMRGEAPDGLGGGRREGEKEEKEQHLLCAPQDTLAPLFDLGNHKRARDLSYAYTMVRPETPTSTFCC